VLAVAGSLDGEHVAAREDPVEQLVVVLDGLERAADVAEHLADLLPAGGNAPLREVDLGVVGEQVKDAAPSSVTPARSNAFRYCTTSDLRSSSVMVCVVLSIPALLAGPVTYWSRW
jgi:hypothetical protein